MEFVGNRCCGTYLSMHRKRRKRSRGTKLHEVSARFPVNSACVCRLLFIDCWYITTLNAVSYFPAVRVREAAHIIKVAEHAIVTSSSSSAILRWAWFEICAIFSCRLSTSRGPGLRLFLLTACRRPGRRRGFRQFSRRKHRHRPVARRPRLRQKYRPSTQVSDELRAGKKSETRSHSGCPTSSI